MNELEETLDQILGTKINIIEGVKPTEGIWYYVWFDPEWKRIFIPYSEYGSGHGHPGFWKRYIAPKVASHYRLDKEQLEQLGELPYSMPRGRVTQVPVETNVTVVIGGEEEKPGHWYLDYGDDFPADLDPDAEKKRIINAFYLTGFVLRGIAHFRVAPHEKMSSAEQGKLGRLLGREIPY